MKFTPRLIAAKTGEGLGQPVLPDNRAGASGVIAAEVCERAVNLAELKPQ